MTQIWRNRSKNGQIERLEPYKYGCGNFMRADSTNSTAPLTPEPTLDSLGRWIETRKNAGLRGGVRMKSLQTPKGGLFAISEIEVK